MITVFYSTCPDTVEALRRLEVYGQSKLEREHKYDEVYNGRPSDTIVFISDDFYRPLSMPSVCFFNDLTAHIKICVDTFETRNFVGVL